MEEDKQRREFNISLTPYNQIYVSNSILGRFYNKLYNFNYNISSYYGFYKNYNSKNKIISIINETRKRNLYS